MTKAIALVLLVAGCRPDLGPAPDAFDGGQVSSASHWGTQVPCFADRPPTRPVAEAWLGPFAPPNQNYYLIRIRLQNGPSGALTYIDSVSYEWWTYQDWAYADGHCWDASPDDWNIDSYVVPFTSGDTAWVPVDHPWTGTQYWAEFYWTLESLTYGNDYSGPWVTLRAHRDWEDIGGQHLVPGPQHAWVTRNAATWVKAY